MIRYPVSEGLLTTEGAPTPAYKTATLDSGDLRLYDVLSDGSLVLKYGPVTTTMERLSHLTATNDKVVGIEGAAFATDLIGVQAIHVVDMPTSAISTYSVPVGRFASAPAIVSNRVWWVEAPEGAIGSIELKLMSANLAMGDVITERTDTHTGGSGGGSAAYLNRFAAFWMADDWAAVGLDQTGFILQSCYAWELGTVTDQSGVVSAFGETASSPVAIGVPGIHVAPATVSGSPTTVIRFWDGEDTGSPFTSLYLDDKWPAGIDTLGVDMYVSGSTVHRLFHDVLTGGSPYKIGTLTTAGAATMDDDITLDLTDVTGTPAVVAPGA